MAKLKNEKIFNEDIEKNELLDQDNDKNLNNKNDTQNFDENYSKKSTNKLVYEPNSSQESLSPFQSNQTKFLKSEKCKTIQILKLKFLNKNEKSRNKKFLNSNTKTNQIQQQHLQQQLLNSDVILTKEQIYDMYSRILSIKKFQHQILFNALQLDNCDEQAAAIRRELDGRLQKCNEMELAGKVMAKFVLKEMDSIYPNELRSIINQLMLHLESLPLNSALESTLGKLSRYDDGSIIASMLSVAIIYSTFKTLDVDDTVLESCKYKSLLERINVQTEADTINKVDPIPQDFVDAAIAFSQKTFTENSATVKNKFSNAKLLCISENPKLKSEYTVNKKYSCIRLLNISNSPKLECDYVIEMAEKILQS
ncbi:hypothetical protein RND71_043310 [Anisodus tanguticus]|uniref:Uncharacterized protein n=1 Tax=Anisodus tanguticus TaxID=243964 RepID=A0AAE1URG8_9SOLA|nr:hypothetical protein RND71_043310 [Anisodus tanguticus]